MTLKFGETFATVRLLQMFGRIKPILAELSVTELVKFKSKLKKKCEGSMLEHLGFE
jgi:hypothetical protein